MFRRFFLSTSGRGTVGVIIVTGASGFIASNLVTELNQRHRQDIVAVDDYPWLRGGSQPTACAAQCAMPRV